MDTDTTLPGNPWAPMGYARDHHGGRGGTSFARAWTEWRVFVMDPNDWLETQNSGPYIIVSPPFPGYEYIMTTLFGWSVSQYNAACP